MATRKTGGYQVYLRVKPLKVENVSDEIKGFSISDSSITLLSTRKRDEIQREEFQFTHVFRPISSQKQIFDTVVYPRLKDVFEGEESLIFSYGTTNSGKSFTMQGTPKCPGIIPRALRTVFASIGSSLDCQHPLKPHRNKSVVVLSENQRQEILKTKECLLNRVLEWESNCDINASISSTAPENVLFDDEAPELTVPINDCLVSVWVSFYEIYNEVLNDLLATNETGLNIIKDSSDDSFYPDGLLYLPVDSWEEAFNIYRIGKKELQVSSTLMNRQSSRSHSVFTVKFILRPSSHPTSYYDINNLSFCDLAGNERISHLEEPGPGTTQGKKETLKINSSLLALNKCFLMMRGNYTKPTAMPSFRESKLTMVFKKCLMGKGKLSMIANISQEPELLSSTTHVLKMTAIAVSTRIEEPPRPVAFARRRFSMAIATPATPPVPPPRSADVLNTNDFDTPLVTQSTMDKLQAENEKLKLELAEAQLQCQVKEAELQQRYDRDRQDSLRHDRYTKELEESLRARRQKEIALLTRLHSYQETCEDLFARLASAFNIDSTDHSHIVETAIANHREVVILAKDEIQELEEQTKSLQTQLASVELRCASLNGQLIQANSELETERELCASLGAQIEELRRQMERDSTHPHHVHTESESGYEATFEEGFYSHQPIRAHQSLRWLSDEESSPQRTAVTTGRKKRGRKKKNELPKSELEVAACRVPRRRLLPKVAGYDHLDTAGCGGGDENSKELQPSPSSIMRSLRSHK